MARTDTPDQQGIWLNPYLFHAANLGVHMIAAVATYFLLRRLVGKPWAACVGALLFALHPVQVEPVAWVAGMKDVLCGALSIIALWQYVVFAQTDAGIEGSRRRTRIHYALATIAYVLAMLSKPSAISLPLVALIIDLGLLKRSWREMILSLAPWIVLAVTIAIVAKVAQPVTTAYEAGKLWLRPLLAADALAFYAHKLVFPVRLAVQYHHSPQVVIGDRQIYFMWIVPLVIVAVAWFYRRKAPWLLVGAAIMVAATLPVLGLIPFQFERYSLVADHYLYVAMLGPAIILAFALTKFSVRRTGVIVIATIFVALGVRSTFQAFHWQSTEFLFRHELTVNPQSAVAYNSLGT